MPHHQLTHEENRAKVCAVCYSKSGSKATRQVSAREVVAIKELVYEGYNMCDERFPTGLCDTCHFCLADNIVGHSHQNNRKAPPRVLKILDTETYDIQLQKVTRGNPTTSCQCNICSVARMNGVQWKKFISDCKKESKDTLGSPLIKFSKLCNKCLAPIYRGSNHSEERCQSKRVSLQNITQAVANSNSNLDLVASKILRDKIHDTGSKNVQLRSDTGGHPLNVLVDKNSNLQEKQITVEEAKVIQIEAGISDNQMGKVMKNLRLKLGRKVVQPGLREKMIADKSKFDQFFTADEVQFYNSDGGTIVRPFVYCSDILGFVSELALLRELDIGDLTVKVGVDSGKGHLKMILSLYDPDNLQVNKCAADRVTRKDGIGSGNLYSLLGRKRVMIIAIAPDTPENYTNLQLFYDMVGINKLAYKQTGDFKALNILVGMMSCSSLFGCCYCEGKRNSSEWREGGGKLRTAGTLSEQTDNFKLHGGGDKARAKEISANSVAKPIIFDSDDDSSTPVLVKCPPPALHLKLGLNTLLMDLYKVWPQILDWLSSKHIILEPYHGGRTLEGNNCSKVLKNLDSLEEKIPTSFTTFMATLRAFRDVVNSTFGFCLDPSYKDVCSKFSSIYRKLQEEFNLSMTNKIHIIVAHVAEFCELVGRGLGEFSEQETENSHSAFDSLLDRYRVRDIISKVYHIQYTRQ